MDKYIHHEPRPRKPIGQKHRPLKSTDYEPRDDVSAYMRRMGLKDND